ncbi:hypothetical protein JOC54_002718 [Alkalihalobacillus xiaoxiensis]|uniref:Lipoprotein n=1 Tax=Shouchella xiaoxiensis TaxID=766895 RepID=A0ABS2SV73_9BACI|nr:hypothetical protein [Shouchella xiaoxiensis]MBM7839438.1 hypothetical protein [Shouchella xiaoxiensis]
MKTVATIASVFVSTVLFSACTSENSKSQQSQRNVVEVPYENGTKEVPTHQINTDQDFTFQFGEDYELNSEENPSIPHASIITNDEKDITIIINRFEHSSFTNRMQDLDHYEYFTSYDYTEIDTQPIPNLNDFGVYKRPDATYTDIMLFKDLNEDEFFLIEINILTDQLTADLETELLAFLNTIESKGNALE